MNRILYCAAILLFCMAGCKKEDTSLVISSEELLFSPESGETVLDVECAGNWDCQCDVDWILVRFMQDKIRVLVDENDTESVRSGKLVFTVGGAPVKEIPVYQEGVRFACEKESLSVGSKGGEQTLAVDSNLHWSFATEDDWYTVERTEDGLAFSFPRNFEMDGRTGLLVLTAGSVSKDVLVSQSGSEWFDSFEMVLVEGGSFYMGSQSEDKDGLNYDRDAFTIEAPVHRVTLDGYYIGKYEVTQRQWQAAMGTNPSANQNEDFPVESITWNDTQAFIALLNEKTGLSYRLPTEAEWEFAAKGGNHGDGNRFSGSSAMGVCGWYYSNSENSLHKTGLKLDNEIGVYDMSGNVREWCNDWFTYYSEQAQSNPSGDSSGKAKINRGGSWATPAEFCRNSYRHTNAPKESAQDLGFRLALSY